MARQFSFYPFYSHYVLLLTWTTAFIGWCVAFFAMCVGEGQRDTGTAALFGTSWFGIFLQLAVMAGFFIGIATDALPLYQLQLSIFGAVALVFCVEGANNIFGALPARQAAGAGFLILAIVDIIWLLFLTSERTTYINHLLNSSALTHCQLTHPSGNRTISLSPSNNLSHSNSHNKRTSSIAEINPSRSNGSGYGGEGIGGGGSGLGGGGGYFPGGSSSQVGLTAGGGESHSMLGGGDGRSRDVSSNAGAPLLASGSEGNLGSAENGTGGYSEGYTKTAKAMYAYKASPDDPQELSFAKGEILHVADDTGKWWQCRKSDGSMGICPSNYLQLQD